MKNWVRKWWREHDTPEFGHSIIAGTMRRMHKLAKLKGMPVCDYYQVGNNEQPKSYINGLGAFKY